MRSSFWRRLSSVAFAFIMLLWLSAAFFITSAVSGEGAINLVCSSESGSVYGMHYEIYRVGSLTGDTIDFQDDFKECPVYLPDMSVSSLQDAASTLENYAALNGVQPLQSKTSDVNGNLVFGGLYDGVYLVAGSELAIGTKIYTPTPMLIQIANGNEITANAKFTVRSRPNIVMQEYQVKKEWEDGDMVSLPAPIQIEVAIYCNEEYVETVSLNQSNGWTYQWSGDANSVWRVQEVSVFDNYKVTYRNNSTQFLIINHRDVLAYTTTTTTTTTNTAEVTTTTVATGSAITGVETSTLETSTETTTTTVTTVTGSDTSTTIGSTTTHTTANSGKLPQTGQLWWPVPVFGVAGIVFFAAGWRINKDK